MSQDLLKFKKPNIWEVNDPACREEKDSAKI